MKPRPFIRHMKVQDHIEAFPEPPPPPSEDRDGSWLRQEAEDALSGGLRHLWMTEAGVS